MVTSRNRSDADAAGEQHSRDRLRRIPRATVASGPWIVLAMAIYLQAHVGRIFLHSDLIGADPPGHFTTGVMLYDFLRHGWPMKPMHFAESFYAQYPKVGLGHWPPMFYVLQAIWYMVFGAKIAVARWLCATIAGCSAWMLYRCCRMHLGAWHGIAAAGLFLAMPVVRVQAWDVMSDVLLAGLAFCAICSLSGYLESKTTKDALLLSLWTSLAILTKGTGWLLLAVIVAAPLVSRQRVVYAKWRYWLSLSLTVLLSAPFYVVVNGLGIGYPLHRKWYVHLLLVMLRGASAWQWIVGSFALASFVLGLRWWLKKGPIQPAERTAVLMATWCFTLAAFIVLVPLTGELNRYFISAIAPGIFLAVSLLFALEQRIDTTGFLYIELAAVLGCAVIFAAIPVKLATTTAYSQALKAIPISNERQAILLEGDSYVEGTIIATRLSEDVDHSTQFVRGSKFIASSDWDGENYQLRYSSPEALRLAMDNLGIEYIVLDASAPIRPGLAMLGRVLADQSRSWKTIARQQMDVGLRHGEVIVLRREPGE
jgi:Dolichyl-phosphate-mannose-protein mannosyltransferase